MFVSGYYVNCFYSLNTERIVFCCVVVYFVELFSLCDAVKEIRFFGLEWFFFDRFNCVV